MKKLTIIAAMFMIGIFATSCHASGKIGTKHHEVGVGTHIK